MKFGKYLEDKLRPDWREYYLDYKSLKDLIKSSAALNAQSAGGAAYSPRTTSLTVVRSNNNKERAEEQFFLKLESEVRTAVHRMSVTPFRPGSSPAESAVALVQLRAAHLPSAAACGQLRCTQAATAARHPCMHACPNSLLASWSNSTQTICREHHRSVPAALLTAACFAPPPAGEEDQRVHRPRGGRPQAQPDQPEQPGMHSSAAQCLPPQHTSAGGDMHSFWPMHAMLTCTDLGTWRHTDSHTITPSTSPSISGRTCCLQFSPAHSRVPRSSQALSSPSTTSLPYSQCLTMHLASCALLLLQVSKAEDAGEKEKLMREAKRIGDEFLALEKYVNLNYLVGGRAGRNACTDWGHSMAAGQARQGSCRRL